MKTVTIETLAEKLNGKLWIKGDLKRIYLNEGYNTKKMATKTFVYEKDGEFKVSCWIACPSQSQNWIDNERQRVVDYVESKIDEAINGEKETDYDNVKMTVVTDTVDADHVYEVGEKYAHEKFGVGEVLSFDGKVATIKFECGVRPLLIKYVKLQKVA